MPPCSKRVLNRRIQKSEGRIAKSASWSLRPETPSSHYLDERRLAEGYSKARKSGESGGSSEAAVVGLGGLYMAGGTGYARNRSSDPIPQDHAIVRVPIGFLLYEAVDIPPVGQTATAEGKLNRVGLTEILKRGARPQQRGKSGKQILRYLRSLVLSSYGRHVRCFRTSAAF